MSSFVLILILIFSSFLPSTTGADENIVSGKDGADMVYIPAGEFIMGLPDGEGGSDKNPAKKVYLRAFYIDKYEVTNALYKRCVSAGRCKKPSLITDYPPTIFEDGKKWYFDDRMGNYPVVGLTWKQAGIYCKWAGKRLPLASEWEKAARGDDGRRYPWGNKWNGSSANWNEDSVKDGYKKLAPVGSFPQGTSPYGAMDMAGNVREWVDTLVLKGGSWYSSPAGLRAGDPGHGYIVERDDDMGFRCAMDTKE